MKKLLFSSILFFSMGVHGQKNTTGIDSSQIKFVEPPDSTGFGTPDGALISKNIGPAGGNISSEDGGVELIFPPGALTTVTPISIQPITNLAPNGSGKSYEFEPSGIQFRKPVNIIFHYTDDEAEICPADLMGFAVQDRRGKWGFFDYVAADSVKKTLSGEILHFSTYSKINKLKLEPVKSFLLPLEKTAINVVDISGRETEGEYKGQFKLGVLRASTQVLWYVNDIENGSSRYGDLTPFVSTVGGRKLMLCSFDGPEYMPPGNPVTIRADIYLPLEKNNLTRVRSLTCKITIYDRYKINVIHPDFEYRPGMGTKVTDSSTFIATIFPPVKGRGPGEILKVIIEDIKTYPAVVTDQGRSRAGCKLKIIPVEGSNSIHIGPLVKNYELNKDFPPNVLFQFPEAHSKQVYFKFQCVGKFSTEPEALDEMPMTPEIEFVANGEEQKVNVNNGTYKLVIRPYREAYTF